MNNFKKLTDFLDKYNVEYTIHSDCVEVKNDLYLSDNKLTSLPESFGNLKIGGSLWLACNKLTSLPESIGNLKIGGSLELYYNNLTSLPESFFLSGLYRKTLGIENLDELHSKFLKLEREKKEAEEKAKREAEEQEEMIRFKSQIWVI